MRSLADDCRGFCVNHVVLEIYTKGMGASLTVNNTTKLRTLIHTG